MISIRPAGALALALVLAACGEKQEAAPENRTIATGAPGSTASEKVYSGTGTVKSITGDQIAIAHGPISGIGWPAMTMDFPVAPSVDLKAIKPGTRVNFTIEKGQGGMYEIKAITPVGGGR